ncbi:MAG: Gfo/Idh/MocA family oxidoreductase [Bacteroidota bacterium]
MNKISFAIIGCGQIAQRHAKHIHAYGQLVAVCDIVERKAGFLAEQYNAAVYSQINELLSSGLLIDVIVICTPNGLHAEHSILALHKGYHVLVEKPMALSAADCKNMIIAAEEAGKKIFTVVQNRFNSPVLAVKKALNKNSFGKISSIQLTCSWNRTAAYYKDSWHGTKNMDGGILFTQFSHFIDLLYWFFGDVKKIFALTKNADHKDSIEFEDCGVVALEFENGIIGTINFSINSFAKNREGSLMILGENGSVKIGGEYLNTIEYAQFANYELENIGEVAGANDYGSYQGSMSNHDKVYQNIVDTLQHGAPLYANEQEGLKTVEIIERIYRAANELTE